MIQKSFKDKLIEWKEGRRERGRKKENLNVQGRSLEEGKKEKFKRRTIIINQLKILPVI